MGVSSVNFSVFFFYYILKFCKLRFGKENNFHVEVCSKGISLR